MNRGSRQDSPLVDEMLDGGQMDIVNDHDDSGLSGQASQQNSSSLLSELTANDRVVHGEFQKQFDLDFFDAKDVK